MAIGKWIVTQRGRFTLRQAALCEGEIKKWWISYRERAIKRNQCLENPENPLPLQPALVAYESSQP